MNRRERRAQERAARRRARAMKPQVEAFAASADAGLVSAAEYGEWIAQGRELAADLRAAGDHEGAGYVAALVEGHAFAQRESLGLMSASAQSVIDTAGGAR